jgi:rRNA maturation endonuclease Nob1
MAVATLIEVEPDIDVYADRVKVWCVDCEGPADEIDGFCESCGGRGHDLL